MIQHFILPVALAFGLWSTSLAGDAKNQQVTMQKKWDIKKTIAKPNNSKTTSRWKEFRKKFPKKIKNRKPTQNKKS